MGRLSFVCLLVLVGILCASSFSPSRRVRGGNVRVAFVQRPTLFLEKVRQQQQLLASSDLDELPEIEYTKGMPDKPAFLTYYKKVVAAGAEMRMDQMMAYPQVAKLLNENAIFSEDISALWISAVADAAGLDEKEAYEMLCMITDLPNPEDVEFLDREYITLAGALDKKLPFFKFLNWKDVQDMMNEEALTMEEVSGIWRDAAGDLNASIDRKAFGKLNNALDDAIEAKEFAEEQDDDEIDLTDIDVWDKDFDPTTVFDPESLEEITAYFRKSASKSTDKITYASLLEWDDVKEMLSEGAMTPEALRNAWQEASKGKDAIDLDTFIRLNVRLDLVMDEIEIASAALSSATVAAPAPAPASPSPSSSSSAKAPLAAKAAPLPAPAPQDDAETFYRTEFKKITEGGRLMRLDMLLEWKEITELLADGIVSEKQIARMFEGMPKEPMGIPSSVFGITEDTFVAFNGMLDVVLDNASGGADTVPVKGSTPSLLINEPARPMPTMNELKLGSLDGASSSASSGSDDASTGLSESELELMQVLDKADNMLNSGSFGDFDQLIGDVNDPRLAALREKRDGAAEVRGQLDEIITELLALGRKQTRCGLDRPEEDVAARLRDLIQGVIEKAPRAASRDINDLRMGINGKWRLLYTNSEMFSFYNGVTGFTNVFPTSKFQDLATQYTSDGYLSEGRYFEKLSTPLGAIDATVFTTWEVVKEMSFMTNENSVVLRNYCTKVTAGPMEYLAEENWKSLRTLSMNELVYVDDRIKIMRNSGALRIFFVYAREA